ncbi:hypothetical protein [Bacillus thermotolerans]|uniref:hypothetical protein n=1 Tax=Bacillus thermotolerans TaxID=1221996 RepID=UPI000F65FB88|nr:hypothetical protein [Bacillus thermotolerans]
MKKLIYCLLLSVCLFAGGASHSSAAEINQQDVEDLLIAQFHKQISSAIKQTYGLRFPQYEKAMITSVRKEALPEPSEEMKPGIVYEVVLKVEVLNIPNKENSLIIVLTNDSNDGKFIVKEARKE